MTLSTPVLLGDVTVYVNTTGNDSNPGTQAAPFLTFARAWQERQRYGTLRAKFTIQLVGVGPYTLPTRLSASLAETGGFLIIRGDDAAEVTHYTGTFTGDFTTLGTIGTSAGLGADTHANRFVKITSGPANGCVFTILKNTDTSITACNKRFKSAGSFTITAGTTFKVFTPGTQTTSTRVQNWRGGDSYPLSQDHRHVFLNLATAGISTIESTVTFLACTSTSGPLWYFSIVSLGGWIDGTILGAPQYAYRSAGIVAASASIMDSFVAGIYSATNPSFLTNVGVGAPATFDHYGGRFAGGIFMSGGAYKLGYAGGTGDSCYRFEKTVTCDYGSTTTWGTSAGVAEWAVTSGSCVVAKNGGLIYWQSLAQGGGSQASGGTTDPAGYGINCTGGGRIQMEVAPTLTGGTPGKDVKTTNNGGQPNSAFPAGSTLDDVQYLEVAKAGTLTSSRKRLNLIEGTGVSITVADDVANDRANVTISAPVVDPLADVTVYVNSTTGNDTNPGTQAQPYATLARAWTERQRYGTLQAVFTVQLVGVGPYDMAAPLGASTCSERGRFFLLGDMTAVTVLASGTCTGPASGSVVPTTAISGGPYPNEFFELLSGSHAGKIFAINESDTNSVTLARTYGVTFANGDQWRIIRPGTVLRIMSTATNALKVSINNWTGMSGDLFPPVPFHWLKGLRIIDGGGVSRLSIHSSQVGMSLIRSELTVAVLNSSFLATVCDGMSGVPGSSAPNNALSYCGLALVNPAALYLLGGVVMGQLSTYSLLMGTGGSGHLVSFGGRIGPGFNSLANTSVFEAYGSSQEILVLSTLTVEYSERAMLFINGGSWRFAVTSGSCLKARYGGRITFLAGGPTLAGGTTDPAGYGIDVRGGGRFIAGSGVAPALTGGTAGADLRTTNVTSANATLTPGTAVNNAADTALGELLARAATGTGALTVDTALSELVVARLV